VPLQQRLGRFTRATLYRETSRGSDAGITGGYVVQARADQEATFAAKQTTSPAPAAKGNLRPDDATYDNIDASGSLPQWLDFLTAPFLFRGVVGSVGYSTIALVTGALHRIFIPSGLCTPDSFQLQYEFLEATAQYIRNRYVMLKSLGVGYPQKGAVPLDCDLVGSGDEVYTDLAGTKTDNAYTATNTFNGTAKLAGKVLTGINDFKWMLDTGVVADPSAMNGGIAGSVNPDNINCTTNLTLKLATDGSNPENNLNLLNYGLAQTPVSLDCLWANLPVATATQWMRVVMPNNVIDRASPPIGGKNGKTQKATLRMVDRGATIAAEAFGTVIGPYAITASSNDKFAVKIDGAGTITVTLTPGASRTAQNIVDDLNANGGFSAVATADVYNGRVRVTSKQIALTGASSSVQFDTAVANNCAATLGFNNTSIPGVTSPLLITFYNPITTAY
jgi:hypothetical protein